MPNHRAPLRVRVATVLVAVTLGLSGCGNPFSGEVTPAAQVGTQASTPTADGDPGDAQLTVAADADPDGWRPDQPIVVNAITGTISEVTVTSTGGQDVAGALSDDRRHWQTSGTLLPGETYAVRATMTGSADTDPVTSSVSISTRESASQFRARISPRDGATVGVGMPILVTFTAPVEQDRRAEVQDALTVTRVRGRRGGVELGLRHEGPVPDQGVLAGTHPGVGDRRPGRGAGRRGRVGRPEQADRLPDR